MTEMPDLSAGPNDRTLVHQRAWMNEIIGRRRLRFGQGRAARSSSVVQAGLGSMQDFQHAQPLWAIRAGLPPQRTALQKMRALIPERLKLCHGYVFTRAFVGDRILSIFPGEVIPV